MHDIRKTAGLVRLEILYNLHRFYAKPGTALRIHHRKSLQSLT